MAGNRKPIDWAAIESDYCKTSTSIREIAKRHRVAEASVRDRAKRYGWVRAASAKPQYQPVKERVIEAEVARAETILTEIAAALDKPPATSASDLVLEAYATLRDVMENSPFPAPRVTAARVVLDLAKVEGDTKGLGGKKAQRQAGADKASSEGRFAVPQPPRSVMQ